MRREAGKNKGLAAKPGIFKGVLFMSVMQMRRVILIFLAVALFCAIPCIADASYKLYGGMDSGKTVFVLTGDRPYSPPVGMNIGTKIGSSYSLADLNGNWQ